MTYISYIYDIYIYDIYIHIYIIYTYNYIRIYIYIWHMVYIYIHIMIIYDYTWLYINCYIWLWLIIYDYIVFCAIWYNKYMFFFLLLLWLLYIIYTLSLVGCSWYYSTVVLCDHRDTMGISWGTLGISTRKAGHNMGMSLNNGLYPLVNKHSYWKWP